MCIPSSLLWHSGLRLLIDSSFWWYSKSRWDIGLFSWCDDHDSIQGTNYEEFVSGHNTYSTKKCSCRSERLKGSLLAILCCVTTSMWYIMQASTLRRYPAQLSLTTWMCFLGAAQTAVYTAIVEGSNPSAWTIGLNVYL